MKDFSKSLLVACAAVVFTASMALADSNINKSRSVPDGGSTTVPQFAKVIDDLPIMPGLVPQEDKDVLFIAGPRRIAETTAKGSVDIDEVYHFYEHSLPQLGWKEVNARIYERGNERLRIDVSGANSAGLTIARFAVEPIAKRD